MNELRHRTIATNGINMHIAEQGDGPLVLLCHGWPELWYSWRHQLQALADAGFHAVAPDMRGFGQTDAPAELGAYTQLHFVGDVVGLLGVLLAETKETSAVIMGHDWGAPVAWNTAMLRPDLIRAVVGMSVPPLGRGPVKPTDRLKQAYQDNFFYQLYFQTPGVAEHELQHDVRKSMRMILYSASGEGSWDVRQPLKNSAYFLEQMRDPEALPAWLTEEEVDYYASEYQRTGFRGGLNWYRNVDSTWEHMGAWAGAKIHQPSLFIAGERDAVIQMVGGREPLMAGLKNTAVNLTNAIIVPGAGHWIQQERPTETNDAILHFLRSL